MKGVNLINKSDLLCCRGVVYKKMEMSTTTYIACMFLTMTRIGLLDSASTESTPGSPSTSSFLSSTTPWSTSPYSTDTSATEATTTATGSSKNSTTHTVTAENSSTDSNETSQSTKSSTTTTMLIHCKNGTCVGNESSCLNETITDTCIITSPQYCYQSVYENGTDTYYTVGCSSSCEFLVEHTDSVTMTTRCCETDLCNSELLEDPAEENAAMKMTVPCFTTMLAIFLCMFFK